MFRAVPFRTVLALTLAIGPVVQAAYPTSPQITDKNAAGAISVRLTDAFVVPKSTSSSTASVARINFLRSEPVPSLAATRLFANDNNGTLYTVNKTTGAFTSYLNFDSVFSGQFDNNPGFAAGLVTFQFDPAYATNGKFYTVHTELGSNPTNFREAVLTEWQDTNINNSTFEGTRAQLLRVTYQGNVHPMGDIAFNPTATTSANADYRNMYVTSGDGGAGEQTTASVRSSNQRLDNFLGKVLRIQPSASGTPGTYTVPASNPFTSLVGNGAKGEIYAYGFRNPHRLTFDVNPANPSNPTLIVNDIGLHSYEEVNIVKPGQNYGYSTIEGNQVLGSNNQVNNNALPGTLPIYTTNTTTSFGNIAPTYPVAQYSHEDGDSISSGFVYRGSLIPQLQGKFVFGDITTARLFWCDLAEMQAADDGNPNTLAAIHELSIFYDNPFTAGDLAQQRLFDIVKDRFDRRNESALGSVASGATDGDLLPGSASVTSGSDPYGIAYGGGRADIRFALIDNELYVLSKADGMIRALTSVPEPTAMLAVAFAPLLVARRRRGGR